MRLYHKTLLLFSALFCCADAAAAGETAVVTELKINVRGRPSLIGEVVTQLERGDKVTVLERIPQENAKPGEPTNWAKIKLPENTPVWVFAPFIKDGVVTASRLNLRAGPGENYPVIGRVSRGEQVKSIRTVEEWMEIQAPDEAYAFVDSTLLQTTGGTPAPTIASATPQAPPVEEKTPETTAPTSPETAVAAANNTPVSTPPAVTQAESAPPTSVAATPPESKPPEVVPPVAQATPPPVEQTAPTVTEQSAATQEQPAAATAQLPVQVPVTSPEPPPAESTPPQTARQESPAVAANSSTEPLPKVAEPVTKKNGGALPKRIVRREGIVRATRSIQAPTWYELVHADTKKTINYLYEENLGVKLKEYRGQKVAVSGEEAIDPRWPNTPILDIQTLDVLP